MSKSLSHNPKLFSEVPYVWHSKDKTARLLDAENPNQTMQYSVPTDLGMIALCAHYEIKKNLDIVFVPSADDLEGALANTLERILQEPGECKKALIYSIRHDQSSEERNDGESQPIMLDERILHVVPLLFCKYMDDKGGYKIGIFDMNSVNYDGFEIVGSICSFSTNNNIFYFSPAHEQKIQVDRFSCRIKSIVDMRRSCSLNDPSTDPFRQILFGTTGLKIGDNPFPQIPTILHKTTQNKSLLEEVAMNDNTTVISKKPGRETFEGFLRETVKPLQTGFDDGSDDDVECGKVEIVEKATYLFHKAKTYREDLERDLHLYSPERFNRAMHNCCFPPEKYIGEITAFTALLASRDDEVKARETPEHKDSHLGAAPSDISVRQLLVTAEEKQKDG